MSNSTGMKSVPVDKNENKKDLKKSQSYNAHVAQTIYPIGNSDVCFSLLPNSKHKTDIFS